MGTHNLHYYEMFRNVPDEAKKTINAGKLKGFTDINPMWRIKKLTEAFGPCGYGWYIEDASFWSESHANETAAFCKVILRVKWNDTDNWSAPIIGIGGSKLAGKGVGDGLNDEAYKMAYTDAISIACKNLGMGADVYFEKDRTKYNSYVDSTTPKTEQAPPTTSAPKEKEKQTMDQNHKGWQKMCEAIVAGTYTKEKAKEQYHLPHYAEAALDEYLSKNF